MDRLTALIIIQVIVSLRAQHLDQLVDRGRRPARRSRGAELHAAALDRRQVGRRLLHRLQGVLCVQEMILLDKNKINAIGNIMIYISALLDNIDGRQKMIMFHNDCDTRQYFDTTNSNYCFGESSC